MNGIGEPLSEAEIEKAVDDVRRRDAESKRPICWLCKKTIKGVVHFQGGQRTHPCHKRCLVVIKRSSDGGI